MFPSLDGDMKLPADNRFLSLCDNADPMQEGYGVSSVNFFLDRIAFSTANTAIFPL